MHEKRLSKAELSRRIGVSAEMVRQYTEGSRPGSDKVPALAKALEVPQEQLLALLKGEGSDEELLSQLKLRTKRDAPRNAGVIIRYSDTGEVFFFVPFPKYLRVVNALVVDVDRPDAHHAQSEGIKKDEKGSG